MKRTLITVALLIGTATTVVFAFGGRSGDKDADGRIAQVKVSQSSCSVSGRTIDGNLWLACTVRYKDGYEFDHKKPIKVEGVFEENFYYKPRPAGIDEVVVCLWRYKVSAKKCAEEHGGKACQYCQKNGFHMEDRIDRKTGR